MNFAEDRSEKAGGGIRDAVGGKNSVNQANKIAAFPPFLAFWIL
jgi:hypothetical protein